MQIGASCPAYLTFLIDFGNGYNQAALIVEHITHSLSGHGLAINRCQTHHSLDFPVVQA